jgi:LPXTG-site transpeptidase (sortase) family protein
VELMKKGVVYQREALMPDVRVGRIIAYLKSLAWSMRWVGAGFVCLAVAGVAVVYIPLGVVEAKYQVNNLKLKIYKAEAKPAVQVDNLVVEQIPEPTSTVEVAVPAWEVPDENYSIYIEKIGAISRVIPDVNIDDKRAYMKALSEGVAAVSGMANPGEVGTTYLFAHSVASPLDYARYNAVFYLLDKLSIGDKIEVVYGGKLFAYEMVGREIVAASDTRYLVDQKMSEKLVLQTCYPPGTSWKRLLVIARRIGD